MLAYQTTTYTLCVRAHSLHAFTHSIHINRVAVAGDTEREVKKKNLRAVVAMNTFKMGGACCQIGSKKKRELHSGIINSMLNKSGIVISCNLETMQSKGRVGGQFQLVT